MWSDREIADWLELLQETQHDGTVVPKQDIIKDLLKNKGKDEMSREDEIICNRALVLLEPQ